MQKYIIMGAQGSGKGTQARMLKEDYDLVHIDVGDTFRWNIQNHTKLGARIRRLVSSGELVPDEVVDQMVKTRLDQHDWNYGFILDGFPRNHAQAEFFLESYDIDAVIVIDVPEEAVIRRLSARRLCARCGLDYNLIEHRPKVDDTCDICGGRLIQRADDTPEAIRRRLDEYLTKTRPIVDVFRRREPVVIVDGTRSPAEVQQRIREELGLKEPVRSAE